MSLDHLHGRAQQFQDVKEMVQELAPQLEGFKQTITTTAIDRDPEETDRRTELTKYVHLSVMVGTILNDLL
jgi:hypothetical protein